MQRRNWTRRRGAVAVFSVLLVADLAAGIGSASLAFAADSGGTPPTPASSAKTVAWASSSHGTTDKNYDQFKNLTLTVSQTENLSNQGIVVSWSGGVTTSPNDYSTNYLQIMQCWGDPNAGPTPQQCQWGAPASNLGALIGSNTGGRGLVDGEDPAQTYGGEFLIPPPRNNPNQRAYQVPFTPISGASTFNTDTYFSATSTNEVTAARTGEDGTGQVVFETQTSLEAPHLGCGQVLTGGAGRPCWLVAVPRGQFNANGSAAASDPAGRVQGSPLSATNWAERIQVKLGFEAIGANCPIGQSERRTVGSELVAEAFTSWQAALCEKGTTYGYSEIGDSEARTQLVSGEQGAAGLAFVTNPLDASLSSSSTLQYAPVTQSAIVVGFTIERNLKGNSPNFSQNGTPVTSLTLNQRLVAKLLTQSYRADVPDGNNKTYLANNPRSIRNDPEFLALNPEFNDFATAAGPDGLMVALGSSDANSTLWRWIQSDPDADDFLNGQPDPWGMTINPAYRTLNLATDTAIDSFPKADLSTFRQSITVPEPGFGTLDMRPYVLDMHEGAYRARKADANVKIVWDETKAPPTFTSTGPQLPGQRFALTITDSTSAARYGLQTASLVNAAGRAIAPTDAAIQSGIDAMVPSSVEGVVVTNPDKRVNAAYPLSMLTYAVVNVCGTDLNGLKDFARLLDYADGAGQQIGDAKGQLPRGYVALPAASIAQTAAAAKALRAEVAKPACAQHIPATAPETVPNPPVETLPPEPTPPPTKPTAEPVALVDKTPASAGGATRYGLLASLLFAFPCLVGGPLLLRRS